MNAISRTFVAILAATMLAGSLVSCTDPKSSGSEAKKEEAVVTDTLAEEGDTKATEEVIDEESDSKAVEESGDEESTTVVEGVQYIEEEIDLDEDVDE